MDSTIRGWRAALCRQRAAALPEAVSTAAYASPAHDAAPGSCTRRVCTAASRHGPRLSTRPAGAPTTTALVWTPPMIAPTCASCRGCAGATHATSRDVTCVVTCATTCAMVIAIRAHDYERYGSNRGAYHMRALRLFRCIYRNFRKGFNFMHARCRVALFPTHRHAGVPGSRAGCG